MFLARDMERMTHYANNDLLTKSARVAEEHEVFLALRAERIQ